MTTTVNLSKTLWPGTLAVNALLLALCWVLKPVWLPLLAMGMLLGLLYVATLSANANKPARQYQQVAISLTRVAITAYAVVYLAQHQPFMQQLLRPALAAVLVMAGCFSYKSVVLAVGLQHVYRGLLNRQYGTPTLDH